MYRQLYGGVVNNRLETEEYLFDMDTNRFRDKVLSIPRIMFSITLVLFYGFIAILIIIYALILLITKGGC